MPSKPKHPCKYPGCNILISSGAYCPKHTQKREGGPPMKNQRKRDSAAKRGYDRRWREESKAYLARHPWCEECMRQGRRTPATEVDHRIPHKGDRGLFWDRDNWQGLCHSCHSIKTAKEDGGFGNRTTRANAPHHPPRSKNF